MQKCHECSPFLQTVFQIFLNKLSRPFLPQDNCSFDESPENVLDSGPSFSALPSLALKTRAVCTRTSPTSLSPRASRSASYFSYLSITRSQICRKVNNSQYHNKRHLILSKSHLNSFYILRLRNKITLVVIHSWYI